MTIMQSTSPSPAPPFDEFEPRKVFRLGRELVISWRSNIWPIIIVALGAGLTGAAIAFFKKPVYVAEISFAIDEDKATNNRSEFSAFSEQLGLEPISGGNIFSSINNIHELLKSRFLIEKTLRSGIDIYGRQTTIADLFLDSLGYRQKWIAGSAFPNLKVNGESKDSVETWFRNGILGNIHKTLLSKHLQVIDKGKNTTLTSVICTSKHPLFSKYFVEALVQNVTAYYIHSKTERSRKNLDIIQRRTDSVKTIYLQALYGRASFIDADINLVNQTFSVPTEKRSTDIQILKAAYMDLSRSLESARTSLMNNTPIIQVLDRPLLPLEVKKPGALRQFVLFAAIGLFLGLFIFTIKFIVTRLSDPQEIPSEDSL